jgi:hypothetical protein
VCLHSLKIQKILLDNDEDDRLEGESPTLYTVLQMKRKERTITPLQDGGGVIQTTSCETARKMTTYLRNKYDAIAVDGDSTERLLGVMRTPRNTDHMEDRAKPFEQAEIYHALCAGTRKRAPRYDGLVREYYPRKWEVIRDDMCDIFNQIFWEISTTPKQKHGVIICPPKVSGDISPRKSCPITLLNTDYMCWARFTARRLRPVLGKISKGYTILRSPRDLLPGRDGTDTRRNRISGMQEANYVRAVDRFFKCL